MKKSVALRVALILSLCLSLFIPFSGIVDAATVTPAAGATDTLEISPVETELTINPGASDVVKTYVTNITKSPIDIEPIENDFIAGPQENGTPYIVLGANSYAPTHSLKRFMLPMPKQTVQPGERKEFDLTIAVPKTAQAGGYYGAVRFAPASPNADSQLNLETSAASLILMTVPGDLVEKLALTNFVVQQDGTTGSHFQSSKGLSLLMKFQNEGNIHVSPFGQIDVKKGSKVVYTSNFNYTHPQATILPDTARKWNIPLKDISGFGKYTVGATITYGSKGESLQTSTTFWVVPLGFIIGGIVAIVLIIALISLIFVLVSKALKRRAHRKSRSHRRY